MEICPQDKRVSLEIRFDDDGKVSLARCCFLYAFSHLTLEEYGKIDDIIDYAENSKINYAKSSNICIAKCFLEKKIKQVDVGISHACNLHCLNCFFQEHKDTPEMKKAYFDTLYKIKGHQLDTIMMNNGGEVFVYYDEIIKYLKSLTPNDTRQVTFVTNLLLLNESRFKELKQISEETGVTYFFLPSVDGIKKESYEAIRLGGTFEKITENLHLLADVFGPQQAVILYTIKKPNINETKDVEKYFMNTFGIRCSISFDVYDKECEMKYNSIFRKKEQIPEVSKEYSFDNEEIHTVQNISREPVLTIVTPKALNKRTIAKLSQYNFIEVHSYSGKKHKDTNQIKYFNKTKRLYEFVSFRVKSKYVLLLDDISKLEIFSKEILSYFLYKTNINWLYIKTLFNKEVIKNDKLFCIPIINMSIYRQLMPYLKDKSCLTSLLKMNKLKLDMHESLADITTIELPNNVLRLNIPYNKIIKKIGN